jgi:hypothetical protein
VGQQLARAEQAVRTVMTRGLREAMNRFNGPERPRREKKEQEKKDNRSDRDTPHESESAARNDHEE